MKKLAALLLLTAFLLPALPQTGFAEDMHHDHDRGDHDRGDHDEHRHGSSHWQGDIHHFGDHDLGRWRGGHWYHGRHDDVLGWWWVLGNEWYSYPHPVYPYPAPFVPPSVTVLPSTANYWYYCQNPAGYYPYVRACYGAWSAVPAN